MQNLEKEYKSHHDEPMPDLWNRIEAGLTDATERREKAERKKKMMKYMPMAAAVLVGIVVIPGAIALNKDMAMTERCAPDTAAPMESYDESETLEETAGNVVTFPMTNKVTANVEADMDSIKDTQCESAVREESIEGRFTVISMETTGDRKICTISDEAGNILIVLCPSNVKLETGANYEMLLNRTFEEEWDYKIEKADSR